MVRRQLDFTFQAPVLFEPILWMSPASFRLLKYRWTVRKDTDSSSLNSLAVIDGFSRSMGMIKSFLIESEEELT